MDALSLDIRTAVKDRYELAIQNGGMLGMCFWMETWGGSVIMKNKYNLTLAQGVTKCAC